MAFGKLGAMGRGMGHLGSLGGVGIGSFGAVKAKLAAGQDASMLFIGDSTGNATDEWIYLFGAALGARYPAVSVDYYLFDDVGGAYGSVTHVTTGSGSGVLTIHNASIAGTGPEYLLGAKFAAAISGLSQPDVIVWNQGKNCIDIRSEFLMGFDSLRLLWPTVPHVATLQNPNRDDNVMAGIISAQSVVMADYADFTVIDAYNPFIALNKASSLYADNLHPSASGTQLYLNAALAKWDATPLTSRTVTPAFLSVAGTNLLANGDFSDWSGALPASWALNGSGDVAVAKDAAVFDGSDPYSARVSGTSAIGRIQQSVSAGNLTLAKAAGVVTLAVREYVPTGRQNSAGRIAIQTTGTGGATVTSVANHYAFGAWNWHIVSNFTVGPSVSDLRAILYADTAANTDSVAYYGRAVMVLGTLPRKM
jgi:hypothetical protein